MVSQPSKWHQSQKRWTEDQKPHSDSDDKITQGCIFFGKSDKKETFEHSHSVLLSIHLLSYLCLSSKVVFGPATRLWHLTYLHFLTCNDVTSYAEARSVENSPKDGIKKKLYIFHHIPITYTPQVFHPHIYFFSSKMGNMLYTVNLVGGFNPSEKY